MHFVKTVSKFFSCRVTLKYAVQPNKGDEVENVKTQDTHNIVWKSHQPDAVSAGPHGPTKFQQDCMKEQETNTKENGQEDKGGTKDRRDISDMIPDTPKKSKKSKIKRSKVTTSKATKVTKSTAKPKAPVTTPKSKVRVVESPDQICCIQCIYTIYPQEEGGIYVTSYDTMLFNVLHQLRMLLCHY